MSVITRQLLAWRHDLTDPAVRRMQIARKPKPVAHDFTALLLKFEVKYDEQGQAICGDNGEPILWPVCDKEGKPALWVPDEQGQPSRPYVAGEQRPRRRVDIVRPHVKMIFR